MASDYGIRVAKDGYDALKDSDANMAFTSRFYSDKILSYSNLSAVLFGTGSVTATLNHNLGYVPQFMAFDYLPGSVTFPEFLADYHGTGAAVSFDANADSTNINFCWTIVSGSIPTGNAQIVQALIFIFERSM